MAAEETGPPGQTRVNALGGRAKDRFGGFDFVAEVLNVFVHALFASLRRRARRRGWRSPLRCGAVTFIQRFGDALNLNVHFHALALEGVYAGASTGGERFAPLPPPERSDVEGVARCGQRGLMRLLDRRGLGPGDGARPGPPAARAALPLRWPGPWQAGDFHSSRTADSFTVSSAAGATGPPT